MSVEVENETNRTVYKDWSCLNCGLDNCGLDRDVCKQCSTHNSATNVVTVEQPTSQQKRKHDEVSITDQSTWKCDDCSHRNFASANECFKCKVSQEVQLKRKKENPNNWKCNNCNNSNFPHRTLCNRCKTPKPGLENQMRNATPGSDVDWICLNCDNNNRPYRVECNKCKLKKAVATNPAIGQFRTNIDWLCMSCGNSNYPYRIACNKCSLPKQQAMTATRSASNPPDGTPENWLCYNCDNVNLPFRTECNKCKINKKEGTNPATTLKRSKTDWKCSVCANVNFFYRVFCNSCKLPKSEIGEEVQTNNQPYSYDGPGVPIPQELSGVPTKPIEQAAAHLYSQQQSAYQQGFQPPQPPSSSQPYTLQSHMVNNKIDNWTCNNCDNLNFPLRTHCNKCRMSKSEAVAPETRIGRMNAGDLQWPCPGCGNNNYHFRIECNKCNAPRPPRNTVPYGGMNGGAFYGGGVASGGVATGSVATGGVASGGDGSFTLSADYGYGYSDPSYGAGFPVQGYNPQQNQNPSQQQSDDPNSDWVCNQCQNVNWPKRSKCNKCSLDKSVATNPSQTFNPQAGNQQPQSSDPSSNWVCSECQNENWPKRSKCNRCGAEKSKCAMNPAQALEVLSAQVQVGDPNANWICSGCQNVNWPKRIKCNKCGMDKGPEAAQVAKNENWACTHCNHFNYSFATECGSCKVAKNG